MLILIICGFLYLRWLLWVLMNCYSSKLLYSFEKKSSDIEDISFRDTLQNNTIIIITSHYIMRDDLMEKFSLWECGQY